MLGLALVGLMFQSGLVQIWLESEEYSHGPLVLAVLCYLVYKKRNSLPVREINVSWGVVVLACVPLVVFLTGAASGIGQLQKHAVWLFVVITVYAAGGRPMLKILAVPLLIALMIIPLPNMLELALTSRLQLISSEVGVWFIRQMGSVVLLQGNVIDMGSITLLVDEACSGLRYLYPLMGLGGIAAYLFRAPIWAKWMLFLATIPITLLMNSFRIAVTGLLVEKYGVGPTEGFLHFFTGWVVFAAALGVLIVFARFLLMFQKNPYHLITAFSLHPAARPAAAFARQAEPGAVEASGSQFQHRALHVILASMVVAVVLAPTISLRAEIQPERTPLAEFPLKLGGWIAQEHRLPLVIEEVAGATDYYYADFSSFSDGGVNLYLSYYASQRGGKIPHSPLVCMPGDGWTIASLSTVNIANGIGSAFEANRLVITKSDRTILAYYWLKQGDDNLRHESLARLDLVRSSIFEGRTDGGLIRLLAELSPGESLEEVDQRLVSFSKELVPVLSNFVPD